MGISIARKSLNNFRLLDLEIANVTFGLRQDNQAHKVIYSNTNTNTTFPLQFVTADLYNKRWQTIGHFIFFGSISVLQTLTCCTEKKRLGQPTKSLITLRV
jgi:hypothetical protein